MVARILFSSIALLILSSCHQGKKAPATPTTVKVMKAQRKEAGQSNRYSASIDAATRVDLAFKVGGYVDRITKVKGSDGKPRLIQEGEAKTKTGVQANDFILAVKYFLKEFPALAQKTRSIIVTNLTSMLDIFLRGALRELFCTTTNIVPELTHEGAVIVGNLPVKQFAEVGQLAQMLMKYIWQRASERLEQENVELRASLDLILPHLFAQAIPEVEVLFLQTGYHFNETLQTLQVAQAELAITVVEAMPAQSVAEQDSQYGEKLPAEPDPGALNGFLMRRKAADPVHYPDISLSVLKLMGPGEYVLMRPGDPEQGHFGLAAHDYTHSTAPNRRFADLVTQRLLKALAAKVQAAYSDSELDSIARNCTLMEDNARKVERAMEKRMAAVALHPRVGQSFSAVVTGVTPKGVFVRVFDPPVEGRLMRGERGLDVGDRLRVTLLSTDPQRGFIDFGRS